MKIKLIISLAISVLLLSACENIKPETIGGGIMGAIAGGAGCAAAVDGKYQIPIAIGCGVLGGGIGAWLGSKWTNRDEEKAIDVLETLNEGDVMSWKNPDTKHQFKMTPLKTFNNKSGEKCRQFKLVVDGKSPQNNYACRKKHGRWEISKQEL